MIPPFEEDRKTIRQEKVQGHSVWVIKSGFDKVVIIRPYSPAPILGRDLGPLPRHHRSGTF